MSIQNINLENKLTIGNICLESLPCQHDCTLNNKEVRLDGTEICQIYLDLKKEVPNHFQRYQCLPCKFRKINMEDVNSISIKECVVTFTRSQQLGVNKQKPWVYDEKGIPINLSLNQY